MEVDLPCLFILGGTFLGRQLYSCGSLRVASGGWHCDYSSTLPLMLALLLDCSLFLSPVRSVCVFIFKDPPEDEGGSFVHSFPELLMVVLVNLANFAIAVSK